MRWPIPSFLLLALGIGSAPALAEGPRFIPLQGMLTDNGLRRCDLPQDRRLETARENRRPVRRKLLKEETEGASMEVWVEAEAGSAEKPPAEGWFRFPPGHCTRRTQEGESGN